MTTQEKYLLLWAFEGVPKYAAMEKKIYDAIYPVVMELNNNFVPDYKCPGCGLIRESIDECEYCKGIWSKELKIKFISQSSIEQMEDYRQDRPDLY